MSMKKKQTAENLFDDLLKQTEEIPIKLKYIKGANTSTPTKKRNSQNKSGVPSNFINFVMNDEDDPLSDYIIQKEIKEKKILEKQLKQLLKKCKKVRVRLPNLTKKKLQILIEKSNKINVVKSRESKIPALRGRSKKRGGNKRLRKTVSSSSSPDIKRIKFSPGALKTKAALKEMPKPRQVNKPTQINKPTQLIKPTQINKPTIKILFKRKTRGAVKKLENKSAEKKKIEPKKVTPVKNSSRNSQKNSPKNSPKISPKKVSPKKKTVVEKTQPRIEKRSKIISKQEIEKKFGKMYLKCHVKILKDKLVDLDSTVLLEKSFKEFRKKCKGGVNKSVSFKETVRVDIYDAEGDSDDEIEEKLESSQTFSELNDTNIDSSVETFKSAISEDEDPGINLNSESFSTPRNRSSPIKSFSPLKTDKKRRSEMLKKSDEKIVRNPAVLDTDDEDDDENLHNTKQKKDTQQESNKKESEEHKETDKKDEQNEENQVTVKIEDDPDENHDNDNVNEEQNDYEDKLDDENVNVDEDNNLHKEQNDNLHEDQDDNMHLEQNDDLQENLNDNDNIKNGERNDNSDTQIENDSSHNQEHDNVNESSVNVRLIPEYDDVSEDYDDNAHIDTDKDSMKPEIRSPVGSILSDVNDQMLSCESDFNALIINNKAIGGGNLGMPENSTNEDDIFSEMKSYTHKNGENTPCSGLSQELCMTPTKDMQHDLNSLPLTKPPRNVFSTIYDSIKSKFPGSSQASITSEKDGDIDEDDSFDLPKMNELQQFETDDESALLGDPVLGGRDRDEISF